MVFIAEEAARLLRRDVLSHLGARRYVEKLPVRRGVNGGYRG